MNSVAETLFFQSGIDTRLFAEYSLQIGDKDWWDTVGIEHPRLAENRGGMMCIRATRLVVIACGMLKKWGASDRDSLRLLTAFEDARFETVTNRARQLIFLTAYSVLAYSSDPVDADSWIHRPSRRWNDQTPLHVLLSHEDGLDQVLKYLEAAVLPVTYLADEMI